MKLNCDKIAVGVNEGERMRPDFFKELMPWLQEDKLLFLETAPHGKREETKQQESQLTSRIPDA